jgi:methyl-accepting chemotaxis protein
MGNAAKVLDIETQTASPQQLMTAIDRAQAIIEFKLDGMVSQANENFCRVFGYEAKDVIGKPHSTFCDLADVASPEYEKFWARLRKGEYVAGEFKRLGKGGKEIWLLASYCPVLSDDGKVVGVIKVATDITDSRKELQARTDIMNMTSIVSESDL